MVVVSQYGISYVHKKKKIFTCSRDYRPFRVCKRFRKLITLLRFLRARVWIFFMQNIALLQRIQCIKDWFECVSIRVVPCPTYPPDPGRIENLLWYCSVSVWERWAVWLYFFADWFIDWGVNGNTNYYYSDACKFDSSTVSLQLSLAWQWDIIPNFTFYSLPCVTGSMHQ